MKLFTRFDFDSAHRLVGHEGKCSRLHGHIWNVEIEIEGNEVNPVGIMWDFGNVKKLKEMFDHKTILANLEANEELIKVIKEVCGEDSIFITEGNPTAEELANLIFNLLLEDSPNFTYKVRVYESPGNAIEVSDS